MSSPSRQITLAGDFKKNVNITNSLTNGESCSADNYSHAEGFSSSADNHSFAGGCKASAHSHCSFVWSGRYDQKDADVRFGDAGTGTFNIWTSNSANESNSSVTVDSLNQIYIDGNPIYRHIQARFSSIYQNINITGTDSQKGNTNFYNRLVCKSGLEITGEKSSLAILAGSSLIARGGSEILANGVLKAKTKVFGDETKNKKDSSNVELPATYVATTDYVKDAFASSLGAASKFYVKKDSEDGSSGVGSSLNPIYVDQDGKAKQVFYGNRSNLKIVGSYELDIGDDANIPALSLEGGILKRVDNGGKGLGGGKKLLYISKSGIFRESEVDVGGVATGKKSFTPIYMESGELKYPDKLTLGGTRTIYVKKYPNPNDEETSVVLSSDPKNTQNYDTCYSFTPISMFEGSLKPSDATCGSFTRPVYMSNGRLVPVPERYDLNRISANYGFQEFNIAVYSGDSQTPDNYSANTPLDKLNKPNQFMAQAIIKYGEDKNKASLCYRVIQPVISDVKDLEDSLRVRFRGIDSFIKLLDGSTVTKTPVGTPGYYLASLGRGTGTTEEGKMKATYYPLFSQSYLSEGTLEGDTRTKKCLASMSFNATNASIYYQNILSQGIIEIKSGGTAGKLHYLSSIYVDDNAKVTVGGETKENENYGKLMLSYSDVDFQKTLSKSEDATSNPTEVVTAINPSTGSYSVGTVFSSLNNVGGPSSTKIVSSIWIDTKDTSKKHVVNVGYTDTPSGGGGTLDVRYEEETGTSYTGTIGGKSSGTISFEVSRLTDYIPVSVTTVSYSPLTNGTSDQYVVHFGCGIGSYNNDTVTVKAYFYNPASTKPYTPESITCRISYLKIK